MTCGPNSSTTSDQSSCECAAGYSEDSNGDCILDCSGHDEDEDGILESCDNCPLLSNQGTLYQRLLWQSCSNRWFTDETCFHSFCYCCPYPADQADSDGDGTGDACDPSQLVSRSTLAFIVGDADQIPDYMTTLTDILKNSFYEELRSEVVGDPSSSLAGVALSSIGIRVNVTDINTYRSIQEFSSATTSQRRLVVSSDSSRRRQQQDQSSSSPLVAIISAAIPQGINQETFITALQGVLAREGFFERLERELVALSRGQASLSSSLIVMRGVPDVGPVIPTNAQLRGVAESLNCPHVDCSDHGVVIGTSGNTCFCLCEDDWTYDDKFTCIIRKYSNGTSVDDARTSRSATGDSDGGSASRGKSLTYLYIATACAGIGLIACLVFLILWRRSRKEKEEEDFRASRQAQEDDGYSSVYDYKDGVPYMDK